MRWEQLGPDLRLCVSAEHTFGLDALLLSDFAKPRPDAWACDLGSGCGIVPALWFRAAKTAPARAYAVELRREAVELMERSVAQGGLPADRFFPLEADLRRLPLPKGRFALVTCNPPYQAAGCGRVSLGEADRAARHETACTLDDVCAAASALLQTGGSLCLCQRPARLADAFAAMRAHGLEPKRLRFVQQTAQKPPWLFLLEGRRCGKPALLVEAPFLLEGENGPSPELARLYQINDNGA